MIKKNDIEITKIYYGSHAVDSVYCGTKKVFPSFPILPSGYKACRYLEAINRTGCSIKTDVIATVNIAVYARFKIINPSIQSAIFGGRFDSGRDMSFWNDGYMHFGKASAMIPGSIWNNTKDHSVYMSHDGVYVDDNRIDYTPGENFTNNQKIHMFATNNNNGVDSRGFAGRIYEFKMYDSGVLVFDGIPCIDNNQRPCMYDSVSKRTYYGDYSDNFYYELI